MTSQFQNLKNFIRHGKQARHHVDPPAAHLSQSDPGNNGNDQQTHSRHQEAPAPADARQPAQAKGGIAAAGLGKTQGGKAYDAELLAKLIAEEKANREKLPRYPGLDRYILSAKMGDGAFSNVYRARDSQGVYGEVAIKVVRKFELNASQVCIRRALFSFAFFFLPARAV